jgi:CO/xanthine dehydrogenase FAD-binding subunit
VPVSAFVTGPGSTSREENELLTALLVPAADYDVFWYRKVVARNANSCAKVSFLGLARAGEGVVEDIRLCFGAVAPTVVRLHGIEETLRGREAGEVRALVPQVLRDCARLLAPVDDRRSTASYRAWVSLRLLEHFLGVVLQGDPR